MRSHQFRVMGQCDLRNVPYHGNRRYSASQKGVSLNCGRCRYKFGIGSEPDAHIDHVANVSRTSARPREEPPKARDS